MATNQEIQALVGQMPDPDERGMYTENVDKGRIDKAVSAILKGGGESLQQLIDMLDEPGSDNDVKPHYALHCVTNQALIAGEEQTRRELCRTMAANLEGDLSDYNKAYVCQELQWAGRDEAVPALGKLLLQETLVEPAAMALVAIGAGAAEQFRAALPHARGKCRLNIIDGLAALGDRESMDALTAALADDDREVRLAAGAGLSKIGDSASVDALLKAADGDGGWERIQATKHCLVLAERLRAAGREESARKIYRHLRDTRTDPSEAYIRFASALALAKQ
jgi:hypothetical protein